MARRHGGPTTLRNRRVMSELKLPQPSDQVRPATTEHGTVPLPSRREPTVEAATRLGAAGALLLYALGLLTVNTYLYRVGISDFSLLRARFILTGALTVVPIVLALMVGLVA